MKFSFTEKAKNHLCDGGFYMNFDMNLLNLIYNFFHCDFLDSVMPYISSMGDEGIIWIITAVILLCFKGTRREGIILSLSLVLCLVIGNLTLKPLINRMRPYEVDTSITLLIKPLEDGSFPSGHTLSSFASATALLLCFKKKAIPALVLSVLIAFSRLYLRVHFPSDVLAGIILGVGIGFAVYKFINKKCV